MTTLVGKEYCKVDPSGRFKFPVALKKLLNQVIEDGFIIKESIFDPCLELFPRKAFETELEKNKAKLNQYNPMHRKLFRKLAEGNPVELDANDRLLIPGDQKKAKKIDKEILLISKGDCIEIWDVATYNNMEKESFDFAQLASELLGSIDQSNKDE